MGELRREYLTPSRKPMPARSLIVRYWTEGPGVKRWPDFRWAVIDWGEPTCWACGYYSPSWDKPATQDRKWDSAKALHRAHIIAHSLGGNVTAANLVLLCASCHHDAPMTNEPEFMFRWIEKRETFLMRRFRELKLEIEHHGIDAEIFMSYPNDIRDAAFAQAIRELEPGMHWSGESAAKISLGTQGALCARAMDILTRANRSLR